MTLLLKKILEQYVRREGERNTALRCSCRVSRQAMRRPGRLTGLACRPPPPREESVGPAANRAWMLRPLGGLSNDCSCTSHGCSCCQGATQLPPALQGPLQGLPLALQSPTVSKGTQDRTAEPEGQSQPAFWSRPSSFLQLPFRLKDGGAPHGEHRIGDHHNRTSPTAFLMLCALEHWCSANNLQMCCD